VRAGRVDPWLKAYEDSKDIANETVALIQARRRWLSPGLALLLVKLMLMDSLTDLQDRNLRHPNGGSEASRITAQARRKLGALGSTLDQLRNILEDKSDV